MTKLTQARDFKRCFPHRKPIKKFYKKTIWFRMKTPYCFSYVAKSFAVKIKSKLNMPSNKSQMFLNINEMTLTLYFNMGFLVRCWHTNYNIEFSV